MTALQIVKETIKFYSEHPEARAISASGCYYATQDKRHCAVGRCMVKRLIFIGSKHDAPAHKIAAGLGYVSRIARPDQSLTEVSPELDAFLLKRYQGQLFGLWVDLQFFHDESVYWLANNEGLSLRGKDHAEKLILRYTPKE